MFKKIIIIFVAILIIIVVLVISIFYYKNKETKLPPVFSIVGEITKITENGFSVDKNFLVFIASPTIFSKIEVPQVITQKDANTPTISQEAKFSDLKIKDRVAVESNTNLRNISQFTAKSVQILEYAK